ncbi:deformed epidermal autoregulatory factor 1 homolog isoform X3 [Lampetra planeri]
MDSDGDGDGGVMADEHAHAHSTHFPEGSVSVASVAMPSDHVFTSAVSAVSDHILNGRTSLQLGDSLPQQKTRLIVVHADGTLVETTSLKPPTAALVSGSQPTSAPLSPEPEKDGTKYSWDTSAYENELPVRCRNTSGVLYKNRLGSGGRGKCIKHGTMWYTPSEFEAMSGRASSKDWKRSIRYAGRPLQCLIQDGLLTPHAASCTCASCCDDMSLSGPVRLFVPYKRRKKDMELSHHKKDGSKNITLFPATPTYGVASTGVLDGSPPELLPFERGGGVGEHLAAGPTLLADPTGPAADVYGTSAALSPLPPLNVTSPHAGKPVSPTPQLLGLECPHSELTSHVEQHHQQQQQQQDEQQQEEDHLDQQQQQQNQHLLQQQQRQWQYLEEMVSSLISTAQQLKAALEQAKQEAAMAQARLQAEAERAEQVLNPYHARLESQLHFQRVELGDGKTELIIKQMCVNCGREAMNECTGCHKVHYCSTFCQRKVSARMSTLCVTGEARFCASGAGAGVLNARREDAALTMNRLFNSESTHPGCVCPGLSRTSKIFPLHAPLLFR